MLKEETRGELKCIFSALLKKSPSVLYLWAAHFCLVRGAETEREAQPGAAAPDGERRGLVVLLFVFFCFWFNQIEATRRVPEGL